MAERPSHGVSVLSKRLDDELDDLGVLVGHDDAPPLEGAGRTASTHWWKLAPGDIREWQAAEGYSYRNIPSLLSGTPKPGQVVGWRWAPLAVAL
jgi:hypothetical protein